MSDVKTSPTFPFGDAYANAAGALPGATAPWIDGLRQTSRALIAGQGLPGRKVEAWKYTSLNALSKVSFIPAAQADDVDVQSIPIDAPRLEDATTLVFVNGAFRADLSDTLEDIGAGVSVTLLSDSLKRADENLKPVLGACADPGASFISALNTSYMEEGLVLSVDAGVSLDKPVYMLSIGASGAAIGAYHPRIEISLAAGASATVVEAHIGLPGQSYLSNPVTEVVLQREATLKHYTLVSEDSDASHLGRTAVAAEAKSRYESFILSLGGALVRREALVRLEDAEASAVVDGAYGLSGTQHSDIASEILHLAPDTVSNQTVKGVLGGESRGVFQGRVHVARVAQRTDGRQLHKALLLNRGPEVDCKPELEIYADDVQCAHGATTGEMDASHVFYLMSRGIDEETAQAMLIEGFLDDVIFDISDEDVKNLVLDMVKAWLAKQSSLSLVVKS